jgi:hypothetical protein
MFWYQLIMAQTALGPVQTILKSALVFPPLLTLKSKMAPGSQGYLKSGTETIDLCRAS